MRSKTDSQISLYHYIFCIFILLNCIFYRDFSYISLGSIFYITESFLMLSLSVLIIKYIIDIKHKNLSKDRIILFWFAFIIWGSLLLALDNNSTPIFKVREYASVYYSVFFLLVIEFFRTTQSTRKLFKTILIAALLSMFYIFIRFALGKGNITTTDLVYRYGNYELVGILVLYSFTLARFLQGKNHGFSNPAVLALCVFVVNFLINHRSGSLAMFISTIVVIYFYGRTEKSFNRTSILFFLGIALVTFLVILSPEIGGKALSRISGVFSSSIYQDPNASWRLQVWQHVIEPMSFVDYIIGMGWGYSIPSLHFLGRDYSVDGYMGIHNSFVFYFLHMGVIGITLVIILLAKVYSSALFAIRNAASSETKEIATSLLASNLGILFFSLFNVVLEGPYMSIVFWVTLGLLYRYTRLLKISIY